MYIYICVAQWVDLIDLNITETAEDETVKSSRAIDDYRRQHIMPPKVQIMPRRLEGAKPSSEPMVAFCSLDPWEEISVQLQENTTVFFHWNRNENGVCKMAAILSRPQCWRKPLPENYYPYL